MSHAVHPDEFPSIMAWYAERDLAEWNRRTEEAIKAVVALHDPGRLERLRLVRTWSIMGSPEPFFWSDISDLLG